MKFIQLFKSLANFLLTLSVTFVLILFSVLIILPVTVLLLYRKIVSKYVIHCRKDLSKILTSGAHIFAVDNLQAPNVNVVVTCIYKGKIAVEELRRLFQERVIDLKSTEENATTDSFMYPELRQYYHKWLGFLFWKWDVNFKLENHVRHYDYNDLDEELQQPANQNQSQNQSYDVHNENSEKVSSTNLSRIKANLLKRGWRENQSPWEFLVVSSDHLGKDNNPNFCDGMKKECDYVYDFGQEENEQEQQEQQLNKFNIDIGNGCLDEAKKDVYENRQTDEKGVSASGDARTVLVFRFHHGIGDGLGFFKLLWNSLTQEEPLQRTEDLQEKLKKSLTQRRSLLYYLTLPFRLHFEYAKQLTGSNDKNEWKLPDDKLSGIVKSSLTRKIPIDSIMEIRGTFKSSFSGVMMCLISGAMRKCMISSGLNLNDLPNTIHALLPIPSRYEPRGKLRNHITYIYPALPLGINDLSLRLQACDKNLKRLKLSTIPLMNSFVHRLAGSFPVPMIKSLHKNVFATVLISNFPGPLQQSFLLGQPMTDVTFGTSCHGNNGICISVISYNSDIRISIEVDDAIPSKHGNIAEEIAANIEHELNEFLSYCDSDEKEVLLKS